MAEKVDPDIREYISGIGAITSSWAHHEFVLDILVALDQHLGERKNKKKRHPPGAVGKVGILEDALVAREAYTAPYKQEMIQIISMTKTAAEQRNILVHGAIFSRVIEAKATVIKLTRDGDEETLKEHVTSIHELFVLFQMIFELAAHSWNLVIRMLRAEVPEAAGIVENVDLFDTSKFDWPAINESVARRVQKLADEKPATT